MSPLDINSQPKHYLQLLSDTDPIYHSGPWTSHTLIIMMSYFPEPQKIVPISFMFVKVLNSPPLLHVTALNGYKTHKPAADGTVQQRVLLQCFTEQSFQPATKPPSLRPRNSDWSDMHSSSLGQRHYTSLPDIQWHTQHPARGWEGGVWGHTQGPGHAGQKLQPHLKAYF